MTTLIPLDDLRTCYEHLVRDLDLSWAVKSAGFDLYLEHLHFTSGEIGIMELRNLIDTAAKKA